MVRSAFVFLFLQGLVGCLAFVSHDPNDVAFYLYPNPQNLFESELLEYPSVASIKSTRYDPSKRLIIYSSGFRQNRTSDGYVKNAFLSAGAAASANVLIVEWGNLSGNKSPLDEIPGGLENLAVLPLYIKSASNVEIVGKRVAEFITLLYENGMLRAGPANVHLIGMSLGAHVMGMAAMYFQQETGIKIGRVTGLDPAGPLFQVYTKNRRLDASDAEFVSVIHTNQGLAGYLGALGDADIYVNGDFLIQIQPECKQDLSELFCSHQIAVLYYVQSILNTTLSVTSCNINWVPKEICNAIGREEIYGFGEYTPSSAKGNYYINNLYSGYFDENPLKV